MRFVAVTLAGAIGALVAACTSNPDAAGHAGGGAASVDAATDGPAAGGTGGGSGGTSPSGGAAGAPYDGPTRYPAGAVLSPSSDSVKKRLAAIAKTDATRKSNVFMKVGDSHSVNNNMLYCFAGAAEPAYTLDLGGHDALMPSIEFFRKGEAAGTTPFDRPSLAASVGKSANWAIAGSPTPVAQEISAIDPRFAFVGYGSNDMQLGLTFASAAYPFYSNMQTLLDQIEQAGIVPIVVGLPPRSDDATAASWVPVYDAITRGIAEQRQLPYFSMYLATKDLPAQGLGPDGLHGNVYVSSGAQPCNFTSAGLGFGYDVRNLYDMQALDVVKRMLLDGAPAPDPAVPPAAGEGTPDKPFVIDSLPFTHSSDTSTSSIHAIDVYAGCQSSADESGPERYYTFSVTESVPVRIMLFDRSGVDVDLQLLSGGGSGQDCIARDDRIIERTLAPGSYTLVVDSFVSANKALAGAYLLVVTRCDPADTGCK